MATKNESSGRIAGPWFQACVVDRHPPLGAARGMDGVLWRYEFATQRTNDDNHPGRQVEGANGCAERTTQSWWFRPGDWRLTGGSNGVRSSAARQQYRSAASVEFRYQLR